jgi:hypothetical protein
MLALRLRRCTRSTDRLPILPRIPDLSCCDEYLAYPLIRLDDGSCASGGTVEVLELFVGDDAARHHAVVSEDSRRFVYRPRCSMAAKSNLTRRSPHGQGDGR